MINLLPDYQKIKIKKEERWKKVLIFLFYFIFLFVFLLIILCSVKEISVRFLNQENYTNMEMDYDFTDISEKESKIIEFNNIFYEINYFYESSISLTDIFQKIEKSLPEKTYIKSFHFNKRIDPERRIEVHQIILTGYSPDWNSLLGMEEILKKYFLNIEFSSGTWTQINNIDFLVSFEIKNE